MRFDIVTIFPEFFAGPLDYGIVRRARETGLVEVKMQDLRAFTRDRHRTVDDRPFGGGEGMVLKPEPLFEAVEALLGCGAPGASDGARGLAPDVAPDAVPVTAGDKLDWPPRGAAVVLLSASGKLFRQADAAALAKLDRVVLLCGRYEGVDERVACHLASHELSIGDFVLSGGELAAALVIDAVTRLLPGALGNEASALRESFSPAGSLANSSPGAPAGSEGSPRGLPAGLSESKKDGERSSGRRAAAAEAAKGIGSDDAAGAILLDYPHYTRPAEFRGWGVPEVLLGGNHQEIRRWRERKAVEKTRRNRPDLLAPAPPRDEI